MRKNTLLFGVWDYVGYVAFWLDPGNSHTSHILLHGISKGVFK
jgi:hypothetical protein